MRQEAERTFRPPYAAKIGAVVAAIVFVVILEFMVIVSFVGQKLWEDPRLFHDLLFTLPAALWILFALIAIVFVVRTMAARLCVSNTGLRVRGIVSSATVAWKDISTIWFIRDLSRSLSPAELMTPEDASYESVIVMGAGTRRYANLSSRFFGQNAQAEVRRQAQAHGVRCEDISSITPRDMNRTVPGALTLVERHPRLAMLVLIAVYIAQYVVTFEIWGV
ncbi:hypothetical protein [Devriesea agamarum]|uniref:hypothetical protein n=1 Tax=Devriesea agamarum TaxID=472569 RepID=UPI00071DC38B|nr:hypothetical protein [Devriesea agamarum]